ncbi:MAG: hypothetical protein J6R42_00325 [Clostridia bacterium]|nr:hypothetical protein [Clostridia bacterium]
MGQWVVVPHKDSQYIKAILDFLLPEFERLFGKETMHGETCFIFNDPDAPCPSFLHKNPLFIRLHQSKLTYWCQTIYQLSHELTHYALRQSKQDKRYSLRWFEEIVCEGMSLYILEYAAHHWELCSLSKTSPGFALSIARYVKNESSRGEATNGLSECTTISKLQAYEHNRDAENKRETHKKETNAMYRAICLAPEAVECFTCYQKYLIGDHRLLFDFDKWMADYPNNPLLKALQKMQPKIPSKKKLS